MSTLTKIKSVLAENSKLKEDNLQEFGDTPRPMTTNTRQYDPKSSRIAGIPFSLTGERLAREKGKEYQSVLKPPANPMKMNEPGSTYSKTSGGISKFPTPPNQPTISPGKVVQTPKPASAPSSPVTASLKGGPNNPPPVSAAKPSIAPKPTIAAPSKPANAPVVRKSVPTPDTLKQQVGVTARASQSPLTGKMNYSNAPRGSSFSAPNVAKGSTLRQDIAKVAASEPTMGASKFPAGAKFPNTSAFNKVAAAEPKVSNMGSTGTSSALSGAAQKATSATSNLNKATSTFGDISAKLSKMGY